MRADRRGWMTNSCSNYFEPPGAGAVVPAVAGGLTTPLPVKRRRSWLAAPRLKAKTLFDAKSVPIGFLRSFANLLWGYSCPHRPAIDGLRHLDDVDLDQAYRERCHQ